MSVPDQRYENVIVIPQSALHDRKLIYLVKEGRLIAREVTVQARDGRNLIITGETLGETPDETPSALSADDQIVTTRFPEIGEGVKVRVAR